MTVSVAGRALQSASRPLHLAPLGVGMVVGGGLLAVGLAPLALLVGGLSMGASGALVAFDLLGGAQPPPPAPPPAMPDRSEVRSLTLRQALRRVDEAAAKVTGRLLGQDGVLGDSFLELIAAVKDLVAQAESLVERGDALHTYLKEHDPAELERDIQSRLVAARNVSDSAAAASFRTAAASKRRQLELWNELRGLHDRVSAELVAVEAALGELDARAVRLSLQDPTRAHESGQDASREIAAVRDRVQLLERAAAKTMNELGDFGGGGST